MNMNDISEKKENLSYSEALLKSYSAKTEAEGNAIMENYRNCVVKEEESGKTGIRD